jgi:Ca-activated chloride channel homolog
VVFENPKVFFLFVPLSFFLVASGILGWSGKKEIAEIFQLNLRPLKKTQIQKYLTAGILLSLLVGALALPKLPFFAVGSAQKKGHIALLVDVSGSMAARQDPGSPDRLGRVKPILYEIVNGMEDLGEVKISLHGFTSIARSQVPFVGKEDYTYLKESIKRVLAVNSTPGSGTSLGHAVSNVVEKFPQEDKVKLIILFSDGEAFIGWTRGIHETERAWIDEALMKARKEGVKVITVGVGEREGAKIPLYDTNKKFTGEHGKLREVDYVSYLEEEGLKEIADRTGGRYFFENNREGLATFIKENLGPANADGAAKKVKGYRSIAHWFLLVCFPLWLVLVRYYH